MGQPRSDSYSAWTRARPSSPDCASSSQYSGPSQVTWTRRDARPVVVLDPVAEPLEVFVLGQPPRLIEPPVVGAEDGRVTLVAADHLRLAPCGGPGQAVVAGADPKRESVPGRGRDDRVVGRRAAIEVDVGEGVRVGALDLHLDARPVDGFARRVVHPAMPVPKERAAEAIVDVGRCAMHPDRSPDRGGRAQPPVASDARTPPPGQGTRWAATVPRPSHCDDVRRRATMAPTRRRRSRPPGARR